MTRIEVYRKATQGHESFSLTEISLKCTCRLWKQSKLDDDVEKNVDNYVNGIFSVSYIFFFKPEQNIIGVCCRLFYYVYKKWCFSPYHCFLSFILI